MAKNPKKVATSREGKTFNEKLPVRLTMQEIHAAGMALADVGRTIQDTEEARTVKAKEFNANLKSLKKRQRDLIEQVNRSEESRDIECRETLDFKEHIVRVIRQDTNEEVRTRPMTDDEAQLNFKLAAVDGAKGKTKGKSGQAAPPAATEAGAAAL